MKKNILYTILIVFACLKTQAQNSPLKIYYGLYIKNIMLEERAKEKSNRFNVDAYWWMRYEIPQDTSLIKEIENIEFINSEILENEIDERTVFIDSATGKKIAYITGHMKGDFIFYPNYRYYPMDKLVLPITIESKNLLSEEYQLIADTASYERSSEKIMGVSNEVEIPSFVLTDSRYRSNEKIYETNFGDLRFQSHLKYSRLNFEIILERKTTTFLFKILIPIILITLMAYLVFFIQGSKLEVAAALTVTSLLSCIALQLTLSNEIPVTGYLIASDKIFYLSYALITFAMIETVYTYNLGTTHKIKLAHKIEVVCRWIFPIVFIAVTLLVILMGIFSKA